MLIALLFAILTGWRNRETQACPSKPTALLFGLLIGRGHIYYSHRTPRPLDIISFSSLGVAQRPYRDPRLARIPYHSKENPVSFQSSVAITFPVNSHPNSKLKMPFHTPLAPKSTPQPSRLEMVPTPMGSLPKQRIRHSDEEWDELKPIVTRLFIDENKTASRLLEDLQQSHGFRTRFVFHTSLSWLTCLSPHRGLFLTRYSLRVLKEKLDQWDLRKNLKQSEMKILLAKRNYRSSAGKNTVFYYKGRELSDERLVRAGKRPWIRDETPQSPGAREQSQLRSLFSRYLTG